ncbi:inner centromere protein A-like [Oppia nitens]|uniref:inner centromere protein A-like n=1 Tax=Oppia nitens TaxID=1686743 RepID=UPI0023DBB2A1|nr:inner centromere protein A-like [Oppia nitens]
MGTFVSTDEHYLLCGHIDDKVREEWTGLLSAHNDTINFIIDSAKQMADFIQTDISETRTLRTPLRRTSKRKRSSVTAAVRQLVLTSNKKPLPSGCKVRDVSIATPRRFSKRPKRSTIRLDTTVEEMEVDGAAKQTVDIVMDAIVNEDIELPNILTVNHSPEKLNDKVINELIVDQKQETVQQEVDKEIGENKVLTASEMMSELSINEEINKANESDNEWMTDDEDGGNNQRETEAFFDAMDRKDSKMNSIVSVTNKTLVTNTATKEKRKKSLYFTPQTTQRSTRAQSRMLSRVAETSQRTPQTSSKNPFMSAKQSAFVANTSNSDTSTKRVTGGSSARSVRVVSRIQRQLPDTKTLTDSALKRRQEADDIRRQRLLASQEKEKKAMEKRRILIEQTVNEKKLKSQEKANKAAELRELNKQKESERLRKEQDKREEWERKRQEERREQMRKKQEELLQKARENERRKQLQEMKEMEEKLKKQQELARKQEQEKERIKEQERLAALIQQHNNSLQQKAVANSFIKKCESNSQLVPKVVINKMSAEDTAKHMISTSANAVIPQKVEVNETVAKPEVQNQTFTKDQTFVVNKDEPKDTSSYEMTPPPKELDFDNYDISEVQSGDETDDEQQPRKRIPNWARGQAFIKQVHRQYSKPYKEIYKEIKGVFGSGDVLLNAFKLDFDLMFPKKPLHPRYAKRTSSAIWEEPPSRYRINESSINESFI